MRSRLGAIVIVATIVCWSGLQQAARADGEGDEAKKQTVTVTVQKTADEEGKVVKSEEKKTVQVRVNVVDVSAKVEKALKEAGLEGKRLEKARETISKIFKETQHHHGAGSIGLGTSHMMIVDPKDGKEQKIQLRFLQGNVDPSQKAHVTHVELGDSTHLKKILEAADKHLKAAGLGEEKLKDIREAVEKAVKSSGKADARVAVVVAKSAGTVGEKRYMIGVSCAPVDEALRTQLDLDEGIGLVVDSVFEDTPAKEAGIQKNDVLIAANDKEFKSAEDLVITVQRVGKAQKKLSLKLIRGGKTETVEIAPVERQVMELTVSGEDEPGKMNIRRLIIGSNDDVGLGEQIRALTIGPGVISGGRAVVTRKSDVDSLEKQVDELKEQVKKLQEVVKKMQSSKD